MSARTDRGLLAVVVFVVLFAQVLVYPGVDTLVSAYGATDPLTASTWFLTVEFAAAIALVPVWGAVSDSTGRRADWIGVSALVGAAGYTGLAFLPGALELPFWAILGLRAVQGGATIGAFSLGMTMLMDLGGGHGRNMGAAGIAIGTGTALGAPIGGQLYGFSPFGPLYAAAGLLAATAVLSLSLTDRAPSGAAPSLRGVLAGLQRTPRLAIPYAFGFIDRLTAGFFALVGTLYFRSVFGLDPGATGVLLALFFAPFALLQYPMGLLSDRIGRTIPILAGSVLYGIAVAAVGQAPSVSAAAVAMVAVGVLGATMVPATMALVTDIADEAERGVSMAGFNAVGSLGFLVGIAGGGAIAGVVGFRAAFLVAGLTEVGLALVMVPVFLRRIDET